MAQIKNEQALTDIFGGFPSFHDAEVVSILLERGGAGGPSLEAKIHVHEMTSQVDAGGFYVLKNHTLVTFLFTQIALDYLRDFNQQNVLQLLDIAEINPEENGGRNFEVRMPSSYGCEGAFKCRDVIIAKVEPFNPQV